VALDDALLQEAKEHRDRLLELQHAADKVKLEYHHAIKKLQLAGGSLREIAEALGLSHQRVHQIVEGDPAAVPATPLPPGSWRRAGRRRGDKVDFLMRFTERSRRLMVLAQEEARALRHNYVGTEHLLLAMTVLGEGAAGRALDRIGVGPEAVRERIVAEVGEGESDPPPGALPFTPRAKRVVETALRESLRLGHTHIGTEHLLLAIATVPESVAARVLAALGIDERTLRGALDPAA
jgi:hypothetical protein